MNHAFVLTDGHWPLAFRELGSEVLTCVADVQIAEATAQPFDYTNSSEDDKIQKLLAVRGIAQAGGKEAAAPDVSTPMRAAANLVRKQARNLDYLHC